MKPEKILILRSGALGDFILTLPVLETLRQEWPQAQLEAALRGQMGQLAVDARLLDRFLCLDSAEFASIYCPSGHALSSLVSYFHSFDIVISFLHDPDGVVRQNLTTMRLRRVVYHSPLVRSGHAVDHFLSVLSSLGLVTPREACPRLSLPNRYRQRARVILGQHGLYSDGNRILAIHPGSGSRRKNWVLDGFVAVAHRAQVEFALKPFFILGEAEEDLLPVLQTSPWPVLNDLTLTDLAAVLTGCSAYVGNDSGVTHLAAALGLPVVAIFVATDPSLWGPCGKNAAILSRWNASREAVTEIEVEEVVGALSSVLERRNQIPTKPQGSAPSNSLSPDWQFPPQSRIGDFFQPE
ncbi:MAG: glycosyltransferase family 9 protein [Kiritimatiellia bacterium]